MQIPRAQPGCGDEGVPEDVPVRDDKRDIGFKPGNPGHSVGAEPFRLEYGQSPFDGPFLDGILVHPLAAPGGAVGLGEHGHKPGLRRPFPRQPPEQRERDGIRAQKDDAKGLLRHSVVSHARTAGSRIFANALSVSGLGRPSRTVQYSVCATLFPGARFTSAPKVSSSIIFPLV